MQSALGPAWHSSSETFSASLERQLCRLLLLSSIDCTALLLPTYLPYLTRCLPTRHLTSYLAVTFPITSTLASPPLPSAGNVVPARGLHMSKHTVSSRRFSGAAIHLYGHCIHSLLVGEVHKHRAGRCLQHAPAFTLPAPDFFFFFFFGRRSRYLPFHSIPP